MIRTLPAVTGAKKKGGSKSSNDILIVVLAKILLAFV
jgi:hypothetical protein